MCGSGTSIVAANDLRRQFIGFDISEEYCELAKKRLKKHRGIMQNDIFAAIKLNEGAKCI